MLKRVILHIGTHKTGTTALQDHLAAHRGALARQGVCYPATDRPPLPHLAKHSSLHEAVLTSDAAAAAEGALLRAEAEAMGADTLFLSEEGFSGPDYGAFARLGPLFADCRIEIVGLLRRQDRFVESIWNQYCREGRESRTIAEFAALPRIRERCDYLTLARFWAGVGTLNLSSYERIANEGIVAHIARVTGLRLPREGRRANPSMGMNGALVHAWLNDRGWPVDEALMQRLSRDRRRLALGRTLRAAILADHAAINAGLKAEFGVEFDDDLPEEAEAPLTVPDASFLAELLIDLLPMPQDPEAAQFRARAQLTPDDLRDAAYALQKKRPDAALRMIRAAQAMRPTGPAILRLLEELESQPSPSA